MTHLIAADIHLLTTDCKKTQLFIKFCQIEAAKADQLFILGDLFNTWLGDDISLANYKTVIDAIKTLSKTTQIFVMPGNRDFLLGENFETQTGAKIIREPYLLIDNQQKYLLLHGDSLCVDDKNYQRLKKLLRHPLTQFIFLHLSEKLRLKLSGQLRQKSTEAQRYKDRKIMDINQKFTHNLMQKYPNTHLIHGHTHRQNTHSEKHYTRYVLGDWSPHKGNAIQIDGNLNWLEINATIN